MAKKTIIVCDTIFYQGASNAQTQITKYTGNKKITFSTGEVAYSIGCNGQQPLDVIYHPFITPEIRDVNLQPFESAWSYLNPATILSTSMTYLRQRYEGLRIESTKKEAIEAGSISNHSLNRSQVSYGQTSDWLSHRAKYEYWKQHGENKALIFYGVSRGTAATFCAVAQNQYPEAKLVILEGAIDSMPDVMLEAMRYNLKFDALARPAARLGNIIFSTLYGYNPTAPSPIDHVNDFPENTPVVFITSKRDTIVSPANTENIARALSNRNKNDVYLLVLNNSRHPYYMYDDVNDRTKYETFIHAIYRKYGLEHNVELARAGKQYIQEAQLLAPCPKRTDLTLFSWLPRNEVERQLFRSDIQNNLRAMNWKMTGEQRILSVLDTILSPLPEDHRLGVEKLLTTLSQSKSQSEVLYQHSSWIAELFCTLSCVGFFAVAYHYSDYFALAVGVFSLLSHVIPTLCLNRLDIAAANLAVARMVLPALTWLAYPLLENRGLDDLISPEMLEFSKSSYEATLGNSAFLKIGLTILASGVVEYTVGRQNKDKPWGGALLHSIWHTTTAAGMYVYNEGMTAASPN